MWSKTKSSSAGRQPSWLLALARRLNSWLDHYIAEPEDSLFESEPATGNVLDLAATGVREDDPNQPRSQPHGRSEALEHWLGLVRQVAPEWVALVEQKVAPEYGPGQNAGLLPQTEDELTQPTLEQTADYSDSTGFPERKRGSEPRKKTGLSQMAGAGKIARSQHLQASSDAAREKVGNTQSGKSTGESFPQKATAEKDSEQASRNSMSSAPKSSGPSRRVAVQASQTKLADQLHRRGLSEPRQQTPETITSFPETETKGRAVSLPPAKYADDKKTAISKLRVKGSISAPATDADGSAARRILARTEQPFSSRSTMASTSRRVVETIPRQPQRVLDDRSLGRNVAARKETPLAQTLAHPLPRSDSKKTVAYGWPLLAQASNDLSSANGESDGRLGDFTRDSWPELPDDPPEPIIEGNGLLRGLQHSMALDSEQRGGK